MRHLLTGIILAALSLSAGCASEAVGEEEQAASAAPSPTETGGASEESEAPEEAEPCALDEKGFLQGLEAAMPPDATARMTIDMEGPGGPVFGFDAVIAYTPTGPEMEMSSRTPGEPFALVYLDDRMFISPTGEKGPWTEVPASSKVAQQMREQVGDVDITSSFDAWRAGLQGLETVGQERIGREQTCHYEIEVDAAKAMKASDSKVVPGLPETIVYDIYLTSDQLMRRISFDLAGFTTEINATRWNEPVEIEAPPVG